MKIQKHTQTLIEIGIHEGENFYLKNDDTEPDRVVLSKSGIETGDYIARFNKEDFQEFIKGCQAYLDNADWKNPYSIYYT